MEERQAPFVDENLISPISSSPLTATSSAQGENEAHVQNTLDTAATSQASEGMQQLLSEMQALRQDFDTKVKYDESKERLIDTLHKELQGYREGLHFKILRPLLMDLISLYDDMSRIIEEMEKESSLLSTTVVSNVKSFLASVEETLRHNGVETFQLEEETFVANKQRALKAIATADLSLDKHVARRVRKGFLYENKVLRPEVVETYRYVAAQ